MLSADVLVKGHLLKKGTMVNFPLYLTHHNPEHFPDPDTFDPSRFGTSKLLVAAQKAKQIIPFSAGKRDCIGKRFAMLEMKCALMMIVRNLNFNLLEEPVARLDLTMHADKGILMKTSFREGCSSRFV